MFKFFLILIFAFCIILVANNDSNDSGFVTDLQDSVVQVGALVVEIARAQAVGDARVLVAALERVDDLPRLEGVTQWLIFY